MFRDIHVNNSFFPSFQNLADAVSSVKRTVLSYTPSVIKDNLSFIFSVFGDATMSIPLETYLLSTFVESFINADEASEGEAAISEDAIYWMIFGVLMVAAYPGQALITYKKAKPMIDDFLEEHRIYPEEEYLGSVKNVARTAAVAVVSMNSGTAGYLLVDKFLHSSKAIPITYGVGVTALHVLIRQIFFNSEDVFHGHRNHLAPAKKMPYQALSAALCIIYSLTSATPFAAAFISESESDEETILLMTMLVVMTTGEYLRMHSGFSNYLGVLKSYKTELNHFERTICVASAVIRTGLTMASVKDYPTASKIAVCGLLTPGVGVFQLACCAPPDEFVCENGEDIEMLDYDSDDSDSDDERVNSIVSSFVELGSSH